MQESVLAARTKDKKRVNGVELEVYIAWECCLYVTNYPESYDKNAVEKLFGQVSSNTLISTSPLALTLRLPSVRNDLRHPLAEQTLQGDSPLLLRSVRQPGALFSFRRC